MHEKRNICENQIQMPKSNHLISTEKSPLRGLDFDSASSLSPFQGLSWSTQPPPPRYSTPSLSSEETQMGRHSNSRLHFPDAEQVTVGSVATAECGDASRNKKRKGQELEKRSSCERKRRCRIAERMKTLQELLPSSSHKLSAASVLDKAIEYIKTLELQKAVLSYQQMMMDGLLIPTHGFPVRESAWDNSTDSILMENRGGVIPGFDQGSAVNPSTYPGLFYDSDGLFSAETWQEMPIPGPLFDGLGGGQEPLPPPPPRSR